MKLLTSSPKVFNELVADFIIEYCPNCLIIFMNGWTQHSLKNIYSKDKNACAVAGLESLINIYKADKKQLVKLSN
jgi:hypothetical protein